MRAMGFTGFLTRRAAWIATALAWTACRLGAEPFPVERFYELPEFGRPRLSPDGTKLAMWQRRDQKQYLMQLDLATMKLSTLMHFKDGAELANYWWKNNDLILTLVDNTNGSRDFRLMDLKANKERFLVQTERSSTELLGMLPDDPDHVLMAASGWGGYNLFKLNLRTEKLEIVEKNPGVVEKWIVSRSGVVLGAIGRRDARLLLMTPGATAKDWKEGEIGSDKSPHWTVAGVHPDQHRLVVVDRASASPAVVVALDPVSLKQTVLFPSEDSDPLASESADDVGLQPCSIIYETDRPHRRFLDENFQLLQGSIDAALPDTDNQIVSLSVDRNTAVIFSRGDPDRGAYYLPNRKMQKLTVPGAP